VECREKSLKANRLINLIFLKAIICSCFFYSVMIRSIFYRDNEMTKQENTPVFDSKKYSDQVGDLVTKITSGKLSKEQLKDAKKSLENIQKLANEAIEKFKTILPDLTEAERKIVNAQKFGIADSVINQIFDESEDVLNQSEQKQFIDLLTKVLKSAPKREQNKIFKGSDNLKEALYLHNDDARRVKLKA